MSSQNGDKARHGRLRKAKIARRKAMRELRETLQVKPKAEKTA